VKAEGRVRTILISLGFFAAVPAFAQAPEPTPSPEAAASPTATPFPMQDDPAGLPPGFDDAIVLPPGATPTPTPDPFANAMPSDHDDFLSGNGSHMEDEWDPKKPFPGNYYAFPLTIDVAWHPCLDCSGDVYSRPGAISLWAGYAFQPAARISTPYMAIGLEYGLAEIDENQTWHGRSRLAPTARWGWNFSAASVYATTGIVIPGEDRERAGYHVGIGASSFAFLAVAACASEAIPSVVEVGVDLEHDPELGRRRGAWTLKLGWGF
jgi:hypothetical protein